jgi:hypothetical protein
VQQEQQQQQGAPRRHCIPSLLKSMVPRESMVVQMAAAPNHNKGRGQHCSHYSSTQFRTSCRPGLWMLPP